MTKEQYQQYLQSDHWKEVREAALERSGNRCQVCGSHPNQFFPKQSNLQVHHNNYDSLNCETAEDVVVLCNKCHDLFHENVTHRRAKSYITDRFLHYEGHLHPLDRNAPCPELRRRLLDMFTDEIIAGAAIGWKRMELYYTGKKTSLAESTEVFAEVTADGDE